MGYTLTSWANEFEVWHCRADFDFGVGNTLEAESLKYRALDACKRKIKQQVGVGEVTRRFKRLSYVVVANDLDSLNRMWSITVAEKS